MNKYSLPVILLVTVLSACKTSQDEQKKSLNEISKSYVALALKIGSYDQDFIDAYYGPAEDRPKAKTGDALPYEELKWQTTDLLHKISKIDDMSFDKLEMLRYQFLNKQLQAIRTKLDMMAGKKYPFDVESLRLYDAVAPVVEFSYYDSLLNLLDSLIPARDEDLQARYLDYSKQFIIPNDKLDTVFQAAITVARRKAEEHLDIPENESFVIEYVNNKPWSGYNWYKGNAHSVIQINTDFPIYIERAIDLACHEGYPGHHIFNALLEQKLVNERQWKEFQVYPLFSPQSFIAEGTANFGIEVAYEPAERLEFEKTVLFPLAGIDPALAESYYKIQDLRKAIQGVEIEIARGYLNGDLGKDTTVALLEKYMLFEPERAKQRTRFFDRYRSYIINYSLGSSLVRKRVHDELEANPNRSKWDVFEVMLSTPQTASTL